MGSKNDLNWQKNYEELCEYIALHGHLPDKHRVESRGTGSGTNQSRQYSLNISSADTSKGTVDTSVNKTYSEGSRVNIKATPASGYVFDKWSDGNTSATRTVNMNANTTLVASFKEQTQGGGTGDDEDDNPAFL